MRGRLSAATGIISSAGSNVVLTQPDEFVYDFTTKSVGALDGTTSDSGHTVACFGSRTGSIADSGGVKVFTQDSGSGATYLTTAKPLDTRVVYAGGDHRFKNTGGQTTHSSAAGIISFDQITANQDSASHIVIEENQTYAQLVVNAGGFTTIGGPWSYTDVGEVFVFTEWAIYQDHLIIRTADGSVHSYTHADLEDFWSCFPVFEPVKNLSTDFQPQFKKVNAATLPHLINNPDQLAYYNDLIGAAGYGPYVPQIPGTAPELVGYAAMQQNGSPNAPFVNPGGGAFTAQAGDLIVVFMFNDDSTGDNTPFSGYTTIGTLDGSSCSGLLCYRVATGGETSTGIAPDGRTDTVAGFIYRGASGVGAHQMSQSSSTPTTFPAVTFQQTNGSSKAAAFACRRLLGTPFSDQSSPTGMTSRFFIDSGATGVSSIAAAYDTFEGVSGYGGGSVRTSTGGWVSCVVEIKA